MTKNPPLTLRLSHDDRDALLQHFLALDMENRRLRFGAPAGDSVVREYVGRLDFVHDGLFAARSSRAPWISCATAARGRSSCIASRRTK